MALSTDNHQPCTRVYIDRIGPSVDHNCLHDVCKAFGTVNHLQRNESSIPWVSIVSLYLFVAIGLQNSQGTVS